MGDVMPLAITIGDKYGPAMEITDQSEADAYFARCVEHTIIHMLNDGRATTASAARSEAEKIERMNLGYYAGYYSADTRERVERLFHCKHPIFGSIAENGSPDADTALMAGVRRGLDAKADSNG